MGFHKDKQRSLEWKSWLQRNRDLFVECGLPADVYESLRSWDYFLWHSTLWAPKRPHWFDIGGLNPTQARRLYDFLEREYGGEDCAPHVLRVLRNKLGAPERRQPPGEG